MEKSLSEDAGGRVYFKKSGPHSPEQLKRGRGGAHVPADPQGCPSRSHPMRAGWGAPAWSPKLQVAVADGLHSRHRLILEPHLTEVSG